MIFVLLLLGIPGPLWSEMRPLLESIQRPADQQEPSYPFVRCAGMYLGIMSYGGTNFAPADRQRFYEIASRLQAVAITIRADRQSDAEMDQIVERVQADILAISDLYASDMAANYARDGQISSPGTTLSADLQVCRLIASVKE